MAIAPIPTGELVAAASGEFRPLESCRVLDVGDEATSYGATLLAELGAEVIRLQDGDTMSSDGWRDMTHNVGKRQAVVGATDDKVWGDERLAELVHGADVVIAPLTPTSIGDRVRALAAGRVPMVTTVDRRSSDGGLTRPTTDLTAMAAGGHLTLNGHPDDPPAVPAGELAWKQTSLTVAYAAMGLMMAEVPTEGAPTVEVAVQEAVNFTTLQTANSNRFGWLGEVPSRHQRVADFTTVQAGDGQWLSFTIHPPYWDRFVAWAESELGPLGLTGPEWDDPEYILRSREHLGQHVRALAAKLPSAELIEHGQSLGLLVLPVRDTISVADDPHLAARSFWEGIDTPNGRVTVPGSPYRTSAGRARRGSLEAPSSHGPIPQWSARPTTGPPPPTAARPANQPLAGIRVVDFCWAIAGPLTTRLLASLGADVIKIESEHRIDPIRMVGVQPPGLKSWNTNGTFNDCNPNKRAVTINIDTVEGRELAWQLIEGADVVTANYSPERLDTWGFGWAELKERNSSLVVANMAVMGMSGPSAGWRSYGTGIVAMCGLARHSNPDDRTPDCLGTLHTDFTVPYMAATGIMAALRQRRRTGEGIYLELAQYETAVRLLDAEVAAALAGEPQPPRLANRSHRHAPNVVSPCRGDDAWVAMACRDDADWRALVELRPELAGLDRWQDQDRIEDLLAQWTGGLDKFDAAERLSAAGLPAAALEHLGDHHSPASTLAGYWSTHQHDDVDTTVVHLPLTWNGERLPLRPAPDWFGSTVDIVIDELGVDPDRFAELVADRVLW